MVYHNPEASLIKSAIYRIRVQGILEKRWTDYSRGMTIEHESDPQHHAVTILFGRLVDQSALVGVLNALHDMGCPILSVERIEAG
jgi:hypothetical protein